MNIEIKINLEDLIHDMFCDESTDIEDAVKSEIIRACVTKVIAANKAVIDKEINNRVDEIMKGKVESMIEKTINNVIDGDILIGRDKTPIKQHVENLFTESRAWHNFPEKIKRMGENFAMSIKERYDTAFANRIVVNMKEQGLLREDVVKVLTEDKN